MIVRGHSLRSKVLRAAAKGEHCVNCGKADDTVVLAHLPLRDWGYGASMGFKVPDWLGAHLCRACHAAVDGPEFRTDPSHRGRLLCATIARLFDRGILTVAGEDHSQPEYPF